MTVPLAAAAQSATGPEAVVSRFDATLLQVMREGDRVPYPARYQRLAAVMNETFDFEAMARIAVGATWPTLSADHRHAIVGAFREYSIATYAAEFSCFSAKDFVTGDRSDTAKGALVTATLIPKQDKPIKFGYLLRDVAGPWRIIDIYLDGTISQLAVRRSEFSSVVADSGPHGLVDRLQMKAAKLAQPATCDP